MPLIRIEEVMRRTGLTRKALRHYDERRLLPATKVSTGHKNMSWYYTGEDLANLKVIKLFRELGAPLDRIEMMIHGNLSSAELLDEIVVRLTEEIRRIDRRIEIIDRIRINGVTAIADEYAAEQEAAVRNEVAGIIKGGKK